MSFIIHYGNLHRHKLGGKRNWVGMHRSSGIETSSFKRGSLLAPKNWPLSGIWPESCVSLKDEVVRLYASAKSGKTNTVMLGDPGLKTLRLSPWRLNLHTKWGQEGNGMWGLGPAQRKQIYIKKIIHAANLVHIAIDAVGFHVLM